MAHQTKPSRTLSVIGLLLLGSAGLSTEAQVAHADGSAAPIAASAQEVGISPWGPDDEIGRLNLMTPESRAAILSRIKGGKAYDLATDYYIGMPSWQAAGDPHYQFWMTHTPRGTEVDDPMGVGKDMNATRSYTGSAFSMYSHTGTHIDALNHFGIHGKIWNGFKADELLGDRGWKRTGIEKFPPLIARGVLIDIAAAKGVDMLPDGYRITRQDIKDALARQNSTLKTGDIVLIRTGRMKVFNDPQAYMANPPGMGHGCRTRDQRIQAFHLSRHDRRSSGHAVRRGRSGVAPALAVYPLGTGSGSAARCYAGSFIMIQPPEGGAREASSSTGTTGRWRAIAGSSAPHPRISGPTRRFGSAKIWTMRASTPGGTASSR